MRPAFFFSYCHFARLKIKQHKLKKKPSIIISNFIFLFFYFKSHTQQGQIIHPFSITYPIQGQIIKLNTMNYVTFS